jgi:signal transduction histidine kinase
MPRPGSKKEWIFYKHLGKEKALAEFSNSKGQFVKDDLLIYVLDLKGKMIAHPKAQLVGKDFMGGKDAEGKTLAADIVKAAQEKESGWVDSTRENPKTKKVEPKTIYFEKVDDLIICSEAHKK